ncbi:MAG TPA: hypothetical protein VMF11_15240 [Candidatus Baltobacteraceae bacterium]|nr:hypothetical protein [Candidatus Baltobacteraceae bacterium]
MKSVLQLSQMRYLVMLLLAAALVPVRGVNGNVVTSTLDPRVRIRIPQTARFVGSDRWVLFGISNCQLFVFVQANSRKVVQRLYWVQFESYLPSMPKLHHEYHSTRHAMLGGMDFYVDTWLERERAGVTVAPDLQALEAWIASKGYAIPRGIDSGSDEQHVDALLRARGYALPPAMMSVRFVHTLDGQRKELMIIYSEDSTTSTRWPAAEKRLIERAEATVEIEP